MKKELKINELEVFAKKIRTNILRMVTASKSSHVGSALSTVEIITYLYCNFMDNNDSKNPKKDDRDRFLLSKGHACTAVYATLAEMGYFDKSLLEEYSKDGSILMSHISSDVPGVEFSTGSLGHALPVALGMARVAKDENKNYKVITLISDGELNEGSNWEAFMMATQMKLDNLFIIADLNGIQALGNTKDVMNLEPLSEKFNSFGFDVARVNGHSFEELNNAFMSFKNNDKPKIILADTIKGKGVSFMEGKLEWHYKSPNTEQCETALCEIEK